MQVQHTLVIYHLPYKHYLIYIVHQELLEYGQLSPHFIEREIEAQGGRQLPKAVFFDSRILSGGRAGRLSSEL